jgi:hypothetical protein
VSLIALEGSDARLELGWQLIGESHRPARGVGESLKPVLLVAVEDLRQGRRDPTSQKRQSEGTCFARPHLVVVSESEGLVP